MARHGLWSKPALLYYCQQLDNPSDVELQLVSVHFHLLNVCKIRGYCYILAAYQVPEADCWLEVLHGDMLNVIATAAFSASMPIPVASINGGEPP